MDFKTLNLLLRCSKEFSHEKIRVRDLSDTECMLCSYIFSNAGCSQDDAATALKIDKTTVGKALSTLEKKNFVERTQDSGDLRKKRLNITGAGREKLSDLINIHNDWLSEILTCLSPQEQAQFESLCTRLLAAAQSLAGKHENGGNADAR